MSFNTENNVRASCFNAEMVCGDRTNEIFSILKHKKCLFSDLQSDQKSNVWHQCVSHHLSKLFSYIFEKG